MRKFLIATHGSFSMGVKSSLDIIIGHVDNLFIIQAYVDENKSIQEELDLVLKNVAQNDELIIFSDLMGGSVTNQIIQGALRDNVHIISGFNLPILIDVLLSDEKMPVKEIIETSVENAKNQIVYINKLLKK